ncbi:major facilitator superfamily MFS_1 [Metallosphaera sedula]|uniref:Major facilitator superfamily MFS_1 n=3 Tax=Metallosphaera sedula TaxID=43687 RepID=A4YDY7_METS5|nr:major facilitator superfamily MFS_1 [Metallosphaera sedula DSM 5348]AIM26626.1 major facilitator superfamily MFS_1 [Metallosphaera sedula]BBL46464.1 putative sialic acid transporter [Metallosphaera sedula]
MILWTDAMEPERFGVDSVKAVSSQFVGFLLDSYDLTMILSIAPILAKVLLPPESPLLATFNIILSYSLTIIFRPLGSAIFGNLGDKIGRRADLIITVLGLGLVSALTAALPTYSEVGILSFVLFVLLRVLVGIFAGGEYSAGHPFAMEWTPFKWRGLISGFVQGGFSFGAALAAVVEGAFVGIYGLKGVEDFAWRYVFLTALAPAVIALAVRLSMKETPVFQDVKNRNMVRKSPLTDLFRKPYRRDFFQVMVYMTGMFFYAYSLFAFVPAILEHAPSVFSLQEAESIYSYGTYAAFAGAVTFGALSQYLGRRRLTLIWVFITLILSVPVYYLLFTSAKSGNVVGASLASVLIGIITQAPWGVIPIYLSERFKASMRASGVGFGYSSGIFVGGWFSIYVELMHEYLFKGIDTPENVWFSTAALLILGAIFVGIGQYLGPETLGTRLTEEPQKV